MEGPSNIANFIRRHHVLTLATCGENVPWCANIFYAWMPAEKLFVFTSETATRHGEQMEHNAQVAASIVLETKVVGLVRGLQIRGVAARPEGAELEKVRRAYLRRFPFAALATLELWTLRPTYMKMTDNRIAFGKKTEWHNDEQ